MSTAPPNDPDDAAEDAEDIADDVSADDAARDRRFDVELGTTAAVVVLFLVLRLLAVSHWHWNTVAAVADTFDFSDSFAIAFGTIAGQPWVTGVFVAILLPLALIRLLWPLPEHKGQITVSNVLAVVALAVVAFAMTYTYRNPWTLVGAAAFGLVLVLIRVFVHAGVLRRFAVGAITQIALIAGIGILVLAAVDDHPWMSEERIATTTHGTIDGWVLDEAPGFVHVLTADRDVLILPTGDITDRRLLD
ncbi:MAG: hypothetical protein QM774_03095 [Gordonia sp. (in: high G+C Gram-positive bacteria)]|uniref:hypothetical protein n=1 Tax=Gordonia sp. (in: high G+C Gram-positive bacteria) TaxID=84139 RepID=UPI0039E29B3A